MSRPDTVKCYFCQGRRRIKKRRRRPKKYIDCPSCNGLGIIQTPEPIRITIEVPEMDEDRLRTFFNGNRTT